MADPRRYSRVYHEIIDDPDLRAVYESNALLGQWLRMLLDADAMYPIRPRMPRMNYAVKRLIDEGLVLRGSDGRYTMRGLDAERERRSSSGRHAAAMRWQSAGNATAMPRRAEQRQDESDASSFMSFRPRKPEPPSGERVAPQHYGQHDDCIVCAPLRESK